MHTEVEYKEIKQSEPTALFRNVVNFQNNNRIGLTTLMVISLTANALAGSLFFKEKGDTFSLIGKCSYTNLEILNDMNKSFYPDTHQNLITEDFFDFAINPIYTSEFKIKVKSFKIEKLIPLSF